MPQLHTGLWQTVQCDYPSFDRLRNIWFDGQLSPQKLFTILSRQDRPVSNYVQLLVHHHADIDKPCDMNNAFSKRVTRNL